MIGQRIVRGDVRPGDPLPTGEEWAAMLCVSRTAFRECIKVLAGKGLIEARPKTGTRVRPMEMWNHLDPDVLAWRFDAGSDEDARELFELRRVVEPAAAEFAASRATPEQVAELEHAYRDMAEVADDSQLFEAPDLRFHQLILRMTGNKLVHALAALIETALTTSFRLTSDNPAGQRHSLPLHRAIVDAIAAADPATARAATLALLESAEADVHDAATARATRARSARTR